LGVTLSDEQGEKLSGFHYLVREWNTKINLVSRKDVDNLLTNHIIDSFSALPVLQENPDKNEMMDLGPGGGFPGIPLKICLPWIKLTCLEATQKKARFIETAVAELGLTDVLVVAQHSAEAKKDKSLQEKYDYVTARAVAELRDLVKISFPFLKPGGKLLAYKSSKASDEIDAASDILKKMGGRVEGEIKQDKDFSDKDRKVVIIKKIK
jgi:16S rRNA (guanine527-N7)-methyltransferase